LSEIYSKVKKKWVSEKFLSSLKEHFGSADIIFNINFRKEWFLFGIFRMISGNLVMAFNAFFSSFKMLLHLCFLKQYDVIQFFLIRINFSVTCES